VTVSGRPLPPRVLAFQGQREWSVLRIFGGEHSLVASPLLLSSGPGLAALSLRRQKSSCPARLNNPLLVFCLSCTPCHGSLYSAMGGQWQCKKAFRSKPHYHRSPLSVTKAVFPNYHIRKPAVLLQGLFFLPPWSPPCSVFFP